MPVYTISTISDFINTDPRQISTWQMATVNRANKSDTISKDDRSPEDVRLLPLSQRMFTTEVNGFGWLWKPSSDASPSESSDLIF